MTSSEFLSRKLETAVFAVELAHQNRTLREKDLHGSMPEDVESDIDRFITDMSGAGETGCGIVCGTGTGVMKKKVMELLRPYQNGIVGRIIDKGPILLVVFER